MPGHNRNANDILKKVSRRSLLRNSAITATGALLFPSFITGCSKDTDTPEGGGGNLGGPQLTPEQLQQAADNLRRLRVWITDLYPLCIEYETIVFLALKATKETGGWENFIADIFIDIGFALAASAAIASDGAAAVPAFACLSSFLHDWGIAKDKPDNLDETFADFDFGHNVMQLAIEQQLSYLVDPGPNSNYQNLQNGWNDKYVFQYDPNTPGKAYTIGDLASSYFPDLGEHYNTLQTVAFTEFKRLLWNLVIVKCCSYYEKEKWLVTLYYDGSTPPNLQEYEQQKFFAPKEGNKGRYMRARVYEVEPGKYRSFQLIKWQLGIGGNLFSDEACDILFMDDSPGHIINPDGLFRRDYVFKQFSKTKPLFLYDHEPDGFDWLDVGDAVKAPGSDLQPAAEWDWDWQCGKLPSLKAE
jgi:hypothetical protein